MGLTIELLLIVFNVLTSPDPPRWLGPYKEWIWLQEPGDYLMDQEILPGGLFVLVVTQGAIYSALSYAFLAIFWKKPISTR
jgi:hypothetical protein